MPVLQPKISIKATVVAATIAKLSAGSYSYASQVITGPNEVLTIDGYTPAVNDAVLVTHEGDVGGLGASKNGLYVLTQVGVASATSWKLQRSPDFNTNAAIPGAVCPVAGGSTLANTIWRVGYFPGGFTLDTTAISFSEAAYLPTRGGIISADATGSNSIAEIHNINASNGRTLSLLATNAATAYFSLGNFTSASTYVNFMFTPGTGLLDFQVNNASLFNVSTAGVFTIPSTSSDAALTVTTSYSGGGSVVGKFLAGSLPTGNQASIDLGHDKAGDLNFGRVTYGWDASGSGNNYIQLEMGPTGTQHKYLRIAGTGAVTTHNNTIDDGSGNISIAGSVVGQLNWHVGSGTNAYTSGTSGGDLISYSDSSFYLFTSSWAPGNSPSGNGTSVNGFFKVSDFLIQLGDIDGIGNNNILLEVDDNNGGAIRIGGLVFFGRTTNGTSGSNITFGSGSTMDFTGCAVSNLSLTSISTDGTNFWKFGAHSNPTRSGLPDTVKVTIGSTDYPLAVAGTAPSTVSSTGLTGQTAGTVTFIATSIASSSAARRWVIFLQNFQGSSSPIAFSPGFATAAFISYNSTAATASTTTSTLTITKTGGGTSGVICVEGW